MGSILFFADCHHSGAVDPGILHPHRTPGICDPGAFGCLSGNMGTGIHFKLPFIDRVARKVNLKEQVVDFPTAAGYHKRIT